MSSKKVTKCIASILCAVMLITGISPGIVAKADAIDDMWERAVQLQLPTQTEAAISPVTINPGESAKVTQTYTFGKGKALLSVPINIGDSPQSFIKIVVEGFSEVCGFKVGEETILNNMGTARFTLNQKDGKERKMLILKNKADDEKDIRVEITLYQYRKTVSSPGTLLAGKWATDYNYNGECLYKIKVPSDGVIQIESGTDPNMKNETKLGLNTSLLNSKKKAISDANVSGDGAQYCVKKGTYYLKATNKNGIVMVRYKFKKVKASKNTKKSKAAGMKKGKAVKGILPVGESKKSGRWYKIVIPKKRKVSVTVNTLVGDGQKAYLYKKGKSKPIASGKKKLAYMGKNGKYAFKTRFPLDKGTYYLKVTKESKTASVYYSIRWK